MKPVTIRCLKVNKEEEFFRIMLLDLQGMEDDLVANRVPVEAVRHIQDAIEICRKYYDKKFNQST